jgi:hypothetical protein
MKDGTLATAPYVEQTQGWPQTGRHILAHFDDDTIIVYQAYRPEIGSFAVEKGYFGGEFKYSRMSWIKPNFLWMMYRSEWGWRRPSRQRSTRQLSVAGTTGLLRWQTPTFGCNGTPTTCPRARSLSAGRFSLAYEVGHLSPTAGARSSRSLT